jgi:hypothetical protein
VLVGQAKLPSSPATLPLLPAGLLIPPASLARREARPAESEVDVYTTR